MAKKIDPSFLKACRDKWYEVPEEAVPEKKREQYRNRKKAVDMYIDGFKCQEITNETGIGRTHISEYVEKCLRISDDGEPLGYSALIPNVRSFNNPDAGREFQKLLNEHPELSDFIIGCYTGDKKYTNEKNMNYLTLHDGFLKQCKKLGIQDYEYPFNTDAKGYVSLIKYIKKYIQKHIESDAKRQHKDAAQKLRSTGKGQRYSQTSVIAFEEIQLDGHKVDIGYVVEVDNNDGTYSETMALRPWFIPIVEVSCRCIIGYHLTQSENYNQFEVLKAFQNAILPHQPLDLTIPGLEYPDNGGFPSTAIPEYKNALFSTIMLDNAKAHLAQHTIHRMVETLGCCVSFGSVATPETRGICERLFGTLESKGFHRLPGTTGSNPGDPKRRDPEKEVVKYNIKYEELNQILDVLCAEYNNTPHSALNGETPLEALKRKLRNPFLRPTIADESMLERVKSLTHISKTVTVRGSIKSGKRPYIQYMNCIYRNDILSSDSSFIGRKITIVINPDDLRILKAFTEDGLPIGILHAVGGYAKTQHTIKTRQAAAKLARENKRKNNNSTDPIQEYQEHLQQKSKGNRRAATKADQVRREAGKEEIPKEQETTAEIIQLRPEKPQKATIVTEIVDGEVVTRPMTMEEYYFGRSRYN